MTNKDSSHTCLWIAIIVISVASCITTIRLNTMEHNTEISTPTITPPPISLTPEQQATVKVIFNSIDVAGQLGIVAIGMLIVGAFVSVLIYYLRRPSLADETMGESSR